MAAWEALKGLTAQLSTATTAEDIGAALLAVAKPVGLTNLLILDATKLFSRVGPAIVYASADRQEVENFDSIRPFVSGPAFLRAQASERPFLMSDVRRALAAADHKGWWFSLPGSLKHKDGLVVPIHEKGELVWGAGFTGPDPDLSQAVQSVLGAAVHAGHTRFRELLDSNTRNSPLSPRESECLHWVADGKTDFEVGKILSISPRTVRFHIKNAKEKLGVATRIQAVARRASGTA
jgi:DNA-binding CsgD family transcriptional regulator